MIDKKIVYIPEDAMDYLEGLWYQCQGYRQIVRHLSCQPTVIMFVIEKYMAEYKELFTAFQMALATIINEYASEEVNKGYQISPNFNMSCLVASKCGGCADATISTE